MITINTFFTLIHFFFFIKYEFFFIIKFRQIKIEKIFSLLIKGDNTFL